MRDNIYPLHRPYDRGSPSTGLPGLEMERVEEEE